MADSPHYLIIARILRPHGVRGELSLQIITDFPERLRELQKVYLAHSAEQPDRPRPYRVEGARPQKQASWLLRLRGVEDRDAAELLRGQYVFVSLADAVPLADDEVYLFQVMGLQAQTVAGEVLGRVVDIIETGANDVYVIRGEIRGEVLIPAVPGILINIDVEAGLMIVDPPPGLLD